VTEGGGVKRDVGKRRLRKHGSTADRATHPAAPARRHRARPSSRRY
jgi:hypothetical protein